jgi:hypothetical protein
MMTTNGDDDDDDDGVWSVIPCPVAPTAARTGGAIVVLALEKSSFPPTRGPTMSRRKWS